MTILAIAFFVLTLACLFFTIFGAVTDNDDMATFFFLFFMVFLLLTLLFTGAAKNERDKEKEQLMRTEMQNSFEQQITNFEKSYPDMKRVESSEGLTSTDGRIIPTKNMTIVVDSFKNNTLYFHGKSENVSVKYVNN